MRFMILVKAATDSEAGAMPEQELFADMAKYHEELQRAGVLLDASGLQPSSNGVVHQVLRREGFWPSEGVERFREMRVGGTHEG